MPNHGLRGLVGAFIAGSLIFSASAAGAATTAMDQPVNPWAVLSVMSEGAPAAALCGTAVTAVQAPGGCVLPVMDAAPPPPTPAPPPPVPVEAAGTSTALILGLIAVALGVGAAFALSGHHHGNSPA